MKDKIYNVIGFIFFIVIFLTVTAFAQEDILKIFKDEQALPNIGGSHSIIYNYILFFTLWNIRSDCLLSKKD